MEESLTDESSRPGSASDQSEEPITAEQAACEEPITAEQAACEEPITAEQAASVSRDPAGGVRRRRGKYLSECDPHTRQEEDAVDGGRDSPPPPQPPVSRSVSPRTHRRSKSADHTFDLPVSHPKRRRNDLSLSLEPCQKHEPCNCLFPILVFLLCLVFAGALFVTPSPASSVDVKSVYDLQEIYDQQPPATWNILQALFHDYHHLEDPVVVTISSPEHASVSCFLQRVALLFAPCRSCISTVSNSTHSGFSPAHLQRTLADAVAKGHPVIVRDMDTFSESSLKVLRAYTDQFDPDARRSVVVLSLVLPPSRVPSLPAAPERATRDHLRHVLHGRVVAEELEPLLSRLALTVVAYLPSREPTAPVVNC